MTLPSERTRAISNTRKFLCRLCTPYYGGVKGIPRSVRREALALLRHFPMASEMLEVCRRSPGLFGPMEEYMHESEYTMGKKPCARAQKSKAGRSMDNKSISNWVRQARYRAGKKGIHSDLEIRDIQTTIEQYDGKCALCDPSKKCWGTRADSLVHAFNLSEDAPNVPANVITECKQMKSNYRGGDIASLLSTGTISKSTYLKLLSVLLPMRGGDTIRQYIKSIMGF